MRTIRIAGIIRDSLVNGKGLRDVVFVQGCPHHCEGCHNQHTWDYDGGQEITPSDLANVFKDSPNDMTISGGEPFSQWKEIIKFIQHVHLNNPNKRFWIYTGFQYEDVQEKVDIVTTYVDVIVDGRYIEKLKDSNRLYRGSSNQRLIDVQKTIKEGHVVLWEDKNETQF